MNSDNRVSEWDAWFTNVFTLRVKSKRFKKDSWTNVFLCIDAPLIVLTGRQRITRGFKNDFLKTITQNGIDSARAGTVKKAVHDVSCSKIYRKFRGQFTVQDRQMGAMGRHLYVQIVVLYALLCI